MTDKRREWNNDMMDPDWTPTPQSAFKEFMNRKKVEYMNTHPGMFGTVHVTDWAEEYLKPLESRLSASIRLREILDQDLEAYKTLVHRQAELLERCKPYLLGHDTKCPRCKGAGEVRDCAVGLGPPELIYIECVVCLGTGLVEKMEDDE